MMKFDLHIHSKYSYDSCMDIEKILEIAKKKGLSGISITDHNTIKGSLKAMETAKKKGGLLVIPGIEITTNYGDIIGLFINEEIKSRNALEVIDIIKSQGGIASLAHPFKRNKAIDEELLLKIDAIEVFNSRCSRKVNQKAEELFRNSNIGITAGSDAHFYFEIGRGWIGLEECLNEEDVRKAILKRKLCYGGDITHPLAESLSQIIKALKLKKVYPLRQSVSIAFRIFYDILNEH